MPVEFGGDGTEYILGVPLRDMSDEEWEALGEELQERAIESGLYREIGSLPAAHESNPLIAVEAEEVSDVE